MNFNILFFGLLVLLWLALGTAGWLAVTVLCRRASLAALVVALPVALLGGTLPALLGWRTVAALLCGLALALVGSIFATWQTVTRSGIAEHGGSARSRVGTGEQDG